MPASDVRSGRVTSAITPSSGSPTNMPSTSGTRAIDSCGTVLACGPKQNIGTPKCALRRRISATSASSVGVVLGKMMIVGVKPSRSSVRITSSVGMSDAVWSTTRQAMPCARSRAAMTTSV